MGLDFHELRILERAAARAPLGDVVTLARQNLNISPTRLSAALGRPITLDDDVYADEFIQRYLNATSVESIDYSDFEGATYTADLNRPVDLGRQFDTVIDLGTTEHIFDVPTAWRSMISLCRIGGQIVHSVPSNSECGHGFFQFSPELFLSLYGEANGFADTEIYIAKVVDHHHWYRVCPAPPGDRIMANALNATNVLVVTTKARAVDALRVQQSDYVHAWQSGKAARHTGRESIVERSRQRLLGTPLAAAASHAYRLCLARTGLLRRNPYLQKIAVPGNRR